MSNCTEADCARPTVARGLCNKHYRRLLRHGSTRARKGEWGSGTIHRKTGYRYICTNYQRRAEHRRVMEQVLGRSLQRNEHVHHKNGDKLDNHPENLEVVSPNEHRVRHAKYFRNATHKECAGCRQVLPRSAFGLQKQRAGRAKRDLHLAYCRPCWSQYVIAHRRLSTDPQRSHPSP